MIELASVNGVITPINEAIISVEDRGFLFGDAIYEVINIYNSKPFLLNEHFKRLEKSSIGINLNPVLWKVSLEKNLRSLLEMSTPINANLYIQITRGQAPRSHIAPKTLTPNIVIMLKKSDPPPAEFLKIGVPVVTFPDSRWKRCNIKSTNLLVNIMAKEYANCNNAWEAVLVDDSGFITEGASSNFFVIKGRKLFTYPANEKILNGITREKVIRLACELDLHVHEKCVALSEIDEWDEAFLTGTTTEVLPVASVDGRTVGKNECKPLTELLYGKYRELIKKECG